jgi:hypothetical protein
VGTSNITLIVQCAEGPLLRPLRTPKRDAYPWVLDFLRRNKGRALREVIAAEIDFPETVTEARVRRSAPASQDAYVAPYRRRQPQEHALAVC